MLVPRSFRYATSPPQDLFIERHERRTTSKSTPVKIETRHPVRPSPPQHTATEPMTVSKPVAVPTSVRSHPSGAHSMPTRSRNSSGRGTKKPSVAHDPNALPPAIAALLAVTTIPPPRPNQFRRKPRDHRRMSIDQLVSGWKNDDTLKASYSSSPALGVLLEDFDDLEEQCISTSVGAVENMLMHTRSISSESVPSLDGDDDRSVLSMSGPATPESVRSRRSGSNIKRARAMTASEDSSLDHPLVLLPLSDDDDECLILPVVSRKPSVSKPKATFKSNLTTSLRALKKATISSIASFSLSSATTPAQRAGALPFSDEMLWSHPYIFPHFTSEVRPPSIQGTPTLAQRRYLNPTPLTFEEQEAPFQQALHEPYLMEMVSDVPVIPMQMYSRGRRKAAAKRAGEEAIPEVGKAAPNAVVVRQREPRENSDFLRVVVLEMNMRREGKLESGRARIWLPPRQAGATSDNSGKVPQRWMGVSAY